MAGRTALVKGLVVQADPVGVAVRIRLRAAADFDFGDKILLIGNDRDRVADITFEADGFIVGIQMLAIVTPEAASISFALAGS